MDFPWEMELKIFPNSNWNMIKESFPFPFLPFDFFPNLECPLSCEYAAEKWFLGNSNITL